jgi:hypothetical protein
MATALGGHARQDMATQSRGHGTLLVRAVFLSFGHSGLAFPSSFVLRHYPLDRSMRQQIGFLLQLAALVLLPMLILWQLDFGIPLIVMPALTVVGIILFYIGYKLREG